MNIQNNFILNQPNFLLKKRNHYLFLLILFVFFLFIIALINPWGLVDKYIGFGIVISILLGLVLIVMLRTYTLKFSEEDEKNILSGKLTPGSEIIPRILSIILCLGVSSAFIYWIIIVFGAVSFTTTGIIKLFLNILIITLLLTLVYRIFDANKYFTNIPLVKLIVTSILYIPCLFSGLLDLFIKKPNIYTGKMEIELLDLTSLYILLSVIILYFIYFSLPYFLNKGILQGGKQIINEPIYIDKRSDISTYKELNNMSDEDEGFDYQYGLSFWFWVDERPPSTRASYSKYTSILNYGNKPNILYKANTNTLLIVEEIKDIEKNDMIDLDDEGRRIIYKKENVLLQKWNNIIINYSGGTLDIFYNGELEKSSIGVVPYMTYDTLSIGEENGINGAVCNVVYFNQPLNYNQVYNMYNKTSTKNLPTLYNNQEPLIVQ